MKQHLTINHFIFIKWYFVHSGTKLAVFRAVHSDIVCTGLTHCMLTYLRLVHVLQRKNDQQIKTRPLRICEFYEWPFNSFRVLKFEEVSMIEAMNLALRPDIYYKYIKGARSKGMKVLFSSPCLRKS